MNRELTSKQKFALRAVEKGAVVRKLDRIGWRTISRYYAWDSEITTQIKSLRFTHRLIRFAAPGILTLKKQKEKQ